MNPVAVGEPLAVQFPHETYIRPERSKPVYAFDVDGVLCHTKDAHRPALEKELGCTLRDGGGWDTFGFDHDDPEVLNRLRRIALDVWRRPEVAGKGTPTGQAVLWSLHLQGRLKGYVTRRDPDMHALTLEWLTSNSYPFGPGLSLTSLGDGGGCKSATCLKDGATHLVEDSPKEAWSAARSGLQVVVLRASYNAEFERIWQQNRAEAHNLDQAAWCRIDFISSLEELL